MFKLVVQDGDFEKGWFSDRRRGITAILIPSSDSLLSFKIEWSRRVGRAMTCTLWGQTTKFHDFWNYMISERGSMALSVILKPMIPRMEILPHGIGPTRAILFKRSGNSCFLLVLIRDEKFNIWALHSELKQALELWNILRSSQWGHHQISPGCSDLMDDPNVC